MEEAIPDREGEQIVDDIEDDKFPHPAPNLGFVGGADMQQEELVSQPARQMRSKPR